MIPDRLYELARSDESVSSALAKDPKESPGEAAHRLYGHISHGGSGQLPSTKSGHVADLQRALECGKWGDQRPSDLFLKVCNTYNFVVYHDKVNCH